MTARQRERDAIRLAAWVRGCDCRPDIRHRKPRNGVRQIEVAHDDGCPAADTGPQLVLARGRQTPQEFAGTVAALVKELER